MAGGLGADLTVPPDADLAGWLFGEDQGRYVVTAADPEPVLSRAGQAGVAVAAVGRTGGDSLTLNRQNAISVAGMRQTNEGWLPNHMTLGDGAMTRLQGCDALRHLEVDGTGITDADLAELVAGNPGLERIEARGTDVTVEGARSFRNTHPKLNIVLQQGSLGLLFNSTDN